MKKASKTTKFITALAMTAASLSFQAHTAAFASTALDIEPDVAANVYEENGAEYASVDLNGRRLITYKGNDADNSAEQKAEELADKLRELITDNKFDPDKVLPAREGDLAVLKLDGATVLKFEPGDEEAGAKSSSPIDQSFKVANSIRVAMGSSALPPSILKIAELRYDPQAAKASGNSFSGSASWYGGKFDGRKTSDGSRFDQDGLTAAHRSLPFGTKLLVMNRKTGDSCVVKVNDRGPFVGGRVIDLSRGAAKALHMISSGVATVDCVVLGNQ